MDDKVIEKLDKIAADVNEIKIAQAVHSSQTADQMRRFNELEKKMAHQASLHESDMEMIEADLRPIRAHVQNVQGATKLIALVGTIIGIMIGVMTLWK